MISKKDEMRLPALSAALSVALLALVAFVARLEALLVALLEALLVALLEALLVALLAV